MPKSLLTLSAIHKKDRNRRPSLSSSQHKIVSPKILPTGPNGIPAFSLKRSPPQAIKHNGNRHSHHARSLPARPTVPGAASLPASVAHLPPPRKRHDDDDDEASSTAGSDMEVDIEALDDDDSLASYAFRKPRRRPSESTVTPASSYADAASTGPPPAPAAKTVSAQELAEVYLPTILSTSSGALPIRAMTAALIEMIPVFAEIPPPKQRRLIVKALEGRKGELFEKVSWGHWSYIGHNSLAASAPTTTHFGQARKKSVPKAEKMDDVSYPVVFNFDNDMDSSSEESDWPTDDDETDEEDWRAMGSTGLERCARRESQGRMQAFYMQRGISQDDENAAIEALVRMSESCP
jgi:Putative Sin3 binding protein